MKDLLRFTRIAFAVGGHLAWWALVRMRLLRPRLTPPQRLCRVLERLGTTFVKLGQGLGLRRDLLPDDYVEALQGLQDRVAPFAGEQARREVEHALGRSVGELFAEFEPEPVAAASIAQVHRARLHDGRAVIVKVRRPGIKSEVARDMRLLRLVLRLLLVVFPSLRRYVPLEIVAEIGANLRREMDFRQEARNIQRFAQAFADSTTIQIPGVAGALYSESALVQVRSGGRRIDDASLRADGPRLARAFVDAYLYQFFVLGVFHAIRIPATCSSPRTAASVSTTSASSDLSTLRRAAGWSASCKRSCTRTAPGCSTPVSISVSSATRSIAPRRARRSTI